MRTITIPALLFVLAGCGAGTPDDRAIEVIATAEPVTTQPLETPLIDTDPPALDPASDCNLAQYRPLIGQAAADQFLPTGPELRVFSESDIVTQELLPKRTNIVTNANGIIVRVFCG